MKTIDLYWSPPIKYQSLYFTLQFKIRILKFTFFEIKYHLCSNIYFFQCSQIQMKYFKALGPILSNSIRKNIQRQEKAIQPGVCSLLLNASPLRSARLHHSINRTLRRQACI